jgi:hypothetical protein
LWGGDECEYGGAAGDVLRGARLSGWRFQGMGERERRGGTAMSRS